jgi:hypothetical protein
VETLDYLALPRGRTVTAEIHERVPGGGGVDVSIECGAAGEYAKGWLHYLFRDGTGHGNGYERDS